MGGYVLTLFCVMLGLPRSKNRTPQSKQRPWRANIRPCHGPTARATRLSCLLATSGAPRPPVLSSCLLALHLLRLVFRIHLPPMLVWPRRSCLTLSRTRRWPLLRTTRKLLRGLAYRDRRRPPPPLRRPHPQRRWTSCQAWISARAPTRRLIPVLRPPPPLQQRRARRKRSSNKFS